MTTKVEDLTKRNCCIMGRNTYNGIPEKKRPLPNRLNVVLSRTSSSSDYPSGVVVFKSLSEAMNQLSETELGADIENVWICGGSSVYKEAMASDLCHRIYFTDIKAFFECDAFFPEIPNTFTTVPNDPDIPSEIQEENGIKYQYKIYERRQWAAACHLLCIPIELNAFSFQSKTTRSAFLLLFVLFQHLVAQFPNCTLYFRICCRNCLAVTLKNARFYNPVRSIMWQ